MKRNNRIALAALLFLLPPVLLCPTKVAAQVIRGEPINPPTATNTVVTNAPVKPTAAAVQTKAVEPAKADGIDVKGRHYLAAGFDKLASFRFDVTDDMANDTGDSLAITLKITGQIPPAVKALNGKEVAIKGFMLPLDAIHGKVTEFLILKSQSMCCYGIPPKMNEWVTVRMAGEGVPPLMDRTITVLGTFHVGEFRDNRYLAGIYKLDGDKLEVTAEP